ncbi:MAG: aminoacyl-tRNA hydrolase [Candidatus Ancillula sp.]|jgi:PTH1 family peptidyl-tRNA hydrolase|nr:aminoacyl-tRNA hydrolase [Candidatus Ancillula sp.]
MKIICGLGNLGEKYQDTYHNLGFTTIDTIADQIGAKWGTSKFQALVADGRFPIGSRGDKILLIKPQKFMNLSGDPLQQVAKYYKVSPEDIIVIHDDIDLPFGEIKIKIGGGEGGHNGLRSITKCLGTKEYYRIRIGAGVSANDVLSKIKSAHKKNLQLVIDNAIGATELLITEGLTAAQQKYHSMNSF